MLPQSLFTFAIVLSSNLPLIHAVVFPRAVWSPTITSPHGGEVLVNGQMFNVTWNTSNNIPHHITNQKGTITLRTSFDVVERDPPFPAITLATNFNITPGFQLVQIPSMREVPEGNDYVFILFGDSGNASPPFRIVPDETDSDVLLRIEV